MAVILNLLPYASAAIFLGGIVYKLVCWLAVPAPFPATVFPVPGSLSDRWSVFLQEILLFKSLYRHNKLLWLLSWMMHGSLALIVAGHIVGIYFFGQQFTVLGFSREASRALSYFSGMAAGTVLIIALFGLMVRRLYDDAARATSDWSNYLEIGLLVGIALTGIGLRLSITGYDFVLIRDYIAGIVLFHPLPIPGSLWFWWHFLLVNILMMYLPYSKLIHGLGGGLMRFMLTESPPEYPTGPRSGFASTAVHGRFEPPGSNISVR